MNADSENVERALGQPVLTLFELLRQLMERQALRRIESDTPTDDEVEQSASARRSWRRRSARMS